VLITAAYLPFRKNSKCINEPLIVNAVNYVHEVYTNLREKISNLLSEKQYNI
jgi:hypothetical protein